jgi:hypothetical protein
MAVNKAHGAGGLIEPEGAMANPLDTDATVRRCRQLAAECLQLITVTDADQKQMLVELAEYWTDLADKAASGEKLDSEISLAPIADQLKATK